MNSNLNIIFKTPIKQVNKIYKSFLNNKIVIDLPPLELISFNKSSTNLNNFDIKYQLNKNNENHMNLYKFLILLDKIAIININKNYSKW